MGEPIRKIAISINRNPSTISRELYRNGRKPDVKTTRVNRPRADGRHSRGGDNEKLKDAKYRAWIRELHFRQHSKIRYNAKWANSKARKRKISAMRESHPCRLVRDESIILRQYVERSLKLRWSPEQISLRLQYLNNELGEISHQAIYNYIYKTKPELASCLRRKGKRRRRNNLPETYNQTNRISHSIHNRPKIVDELTRFGDLEGDTIVGKDKRDRLLTHNDRVTGLVSISLIHNFNVHNIMSQTTSDIKRVFSKAHTITYDNGIEFSLWHEIEKRTGATIFFADPYTPGQRGRNENTNGLIRDFFPKGTDFKKLTENDILKVESLLNNRPRKRLGGKTPIEASVALNCLT